jgi:hypothetical protein
MQQVALPSLYAPRRGAAHTAPFPLVRPARRERSRPPRARKFVAGLLFGVFLSLTLALLGYEARVYFDEHPGKLRETLEAIKAIDL